jgi:hypothetical protein
VCPYCRKVIDELVSDPRYRQARSLDTDYLTEQTIATMYNTTTPASVPPEVAEFIPPVFVPDSRIMRRQILRIRKLRQREAEREYNRQRSRSVPNSTTTRTARRRELRLEISDTLFMMDEDLENA